MENKTQTTKDKPTFVLVGLTNVGKSTLFNRIIGRSQAVTAYEEGTTRDRQYGEADWQSKKFTLVDTGGLLNDKGDFNQEVLKQTEKAIEDADIILFVVNGREELSQRESQLIAEFRKNNIVWIIANKIDSSNIAEKAISYDFLGLPYYQVSSISGKGVGDLLDELTKDVKKDDTYERDKHLIAIIGRPNVGKSTLLNALINEERAVVSDVPGTTRDPVLGKFNLKGRDVVLADTAGVRRRGKIEVGAEKFSVERTENLIDQSKVVLALVDASEGLTRGDLHLIFRAKDSRKPVLIVVNKMDLNPSFQPNRHVKNVEFVAISAKEKIGLGQIKNWLSKELASYV